MDGSQWIACTNGIVVQADVDAPITPAGAALALALAFVFGLAFEEVHARSAPNRPGGIRTFPLLALAGAALFALEPRFGLLFAAGLLVLGAWQLAYYRSRLAADAGDEGTGAELVIPLCNLLAFALGPISLRLPAWFAVGVTVAAALLLGARERLHALARRVSTREIATLGEFLVLIGIVLPLTPDEAVTSWTPITPRQLWLAVVVVCSLSYGSYLVQRFASPARGVLLTAVLGGLYSSTATTLVLSRRLAEGSISRRGANAGIVLATSLMYLRIGVVVALFNHELALALAPALGALLALGLAAAAACARLLPSGGDDTAAAQPRNPLELGTALLFAVMFVVISIGSVWIEDHYGRPGLYGLAAVVGVTDIDPFVLSVAQGGVPSLGVGSLAAAIVVAASSNNVLKAAYALGLARRASLPALVGLVGLAAAGAAAVVLVGRSG